MQKIKVYTFLDSAIIYLLFIFMVCEHHVKFTAIKNISLYTALLMALILFCIDKSRLLKNIRLNFNLAKITTTSLLLFVGYAFLVSIFPYKDNVGSLVGSFKEFGRGLAFLFIVFAWSNGNEKKVKIFFFSCIVAFLFITIYYSESLISRFGDITNKNIDIGRIIRREYADYVDRFMAFAIMFIILVKNNVTKIITILFCFLVVIMDILSGTRGSWVSIFICILLCGIFIGCSKYKYVIKDNFKIILFIAVSGICLVIFMLFNSSIVNYKFSQGADTSGRYTLVKERLPVFLDSKRALFGLGYGKEQYDEFLRDEMDKGNKFSMMQIRPDTKKRFWFNDEPFFIGNFYYFGIFGTLMLFCSFVSLLYYSFKEFKKMQDLMFVAIFISIFCYFGVRGLFEAINLRILYLFYMLGFFIIVSRYYKEKREITNER